MMCERLGDAGAAESIKALMLDVNGGLSMVDDLNKRSGWAIASDLPQPKPRPKTTR